MKFKFSKSQWEEMGKKAGWIKEAEDFVTPGEIEAQKYIKTQIKSLNGLIGVFDMLEENRGIPDLEISRDTSLSKLKNVHVQARSIKSSAKQMVEICDNIIRGIEKYFPDFVRKAYPLEFQKPSEDNK